MISDFRNFFEKILGLIDFLLGIFDCRFSEMILCLIDFFDTFGYD